MANQEETKWPAGSGFSSYTKERAQAELDALGREKLSVERRLQVAKDEQQPTAGLERQLKEIAEQEKVLGNVASKARSEGAA